MTITTLNDVSARGDFIATAGQTVFPLAFKFFDNTDLKVYVNGVLKALTTDYTVAGADADTGMQVTFVAGRALNDAVSIVRVVPYDRTSQFPTSGPFNVAALNTYLTRIAAMLQQLRDSIGRTLTLQLSDVNGSSAFDAQGNRIKNLGNPLSAQDAVTVAYADANYGAAAAVAHATVVALNWSPSSWITTYFGQMTTLAPTELIAVSPNGQNTAIFAARTSDDPTIGATSTTTIPLSCLVVADNTSQPHRSWGFYLEGHAKAGANQYQHINEENSLESFWTSASSLDPFNDNAIGSTIAHRIDSGYGSAPAGIKPVDVALSIVSNGSTFKKGIVFGSTALDTSGGVASMLAAAPNQAVDWFSGFATLAMRINYNATTGGHLYFGNTGLGAPGTNSAGERIQLYGTAGSLAVGDYAIGVESGAVWFNSGSAFKWYQSGSLMADLTSTGFTCYNTVNISGGALQVGGVQVVAARNTGWAAMTGTPNKATVYDVSTVTLAQLAARVAQLQAVLTSHGLIGA